MKKHLTLWMLTVAIIFGVGCSGIANKAHNLPPAQQLHEPGPGVGGPGPGVIPAGPPHLPMIAPPMEAPAVQVLFDSPENLKIQWDAGGAGMLDSTPLVVPGRQNFGSGNIYQLKLTGIPNREGVELYPTLEIGPLTVKTHSYLAHSAIPIQFTDEDFDQIATGNLVTKVIYLPDPEFQVLAVADVETLVSTRLDPGQDPIVEADRRGTIMAIVRVGNKDKEVPGSEGSIVPAGHFQGAGGIAGGPAPMGPTMLAPPYVAGVTAPSYGMPISGTPIGLPGPPHIPLGVPAGLTRHSIKNHTPMHLPRPTRHLDIHVRQQPGYSYPKPPSRVHIREQSIHPGLPFGQQHSNRQQLVK